MGAVAVAESTAAKCKVHARQCCRPEGRCGWRMRWVMWHINKYLDPCRDEWRAWGWVRDDVSRIQTRDSPKQRWRRHFRSPHHAVKWVLRPRRGCKMDCGCTEMVGEVRDSPHEWREPWVTRRLDEGSVAARTSPCNFMFCGAVSAVCIQNARNKHQSMRNCMVHHVIYDQREWTTIWCTGG